jgi:hypothetical protein
VSSQVCVPKTATAEVAGAEMPSTEMAVGEMSPAEVPSTEVTATEVPAEMHASEMAAPEPTEMTEPPEVTAAEMTAAPETAEMTPAAEMTAAAAVPKGKSFAYHARHHTRRERYFEAEPERQRCCENFPHPTSHGGLLPPALRNYDPLSIAYRANAWTVPRVPSNLSMA